MKIPLLRAAFTALSFTTFACGGPASQAPSNAPHGSGGGEAAPPPAGSTPAGASGSAPVPGSVTPR